jgi:hypothetical protein
VESDRGTAAFLKKVFAQPVGTKRGKYKFCPQSNRLYRQTMIRNAVYINVIQKPRFLDGFILHLPPIVAVKTAAQGIGGGRSSRGAAAGLRLGGAPEARPKPPKQSF